MARSYGDILISTLAVTECEVRGNWGHRNYSYGRLESRLSIGVKLTSPYFSLRILFLYIQSRSHATEVRFYSDQLTHPIFLCTLFYLLELVLEEDGRSWHFRKYRSGSWEESHGQEAGHNVPRILQRGWQFVRCHARPPRHKHLLKQDAWHGARSEIEQRIWTWKQALWGYVQVRPWRHQGGVGCKRRAGWTKVSSKQDLPSITRKSLLQYHDCLYGQWSGVFRVCFLSFSLIQWAGLYVGLSQTLRSTMLAVIKYLLTCCSNFSQYHVHPYGEINCVVQIDESAELKGMQGWQGAGWTSPGPGTHHYPQVRKGALVALFFLPAGRISYNMKPGQPQPLSI